MYLATTIKRKQLVNILHALSKTLANRQNFENNWNNK